jgi:hypothetical protein
VQATPIKVGKIKDYPSEEAAWRRVDELHLNPNQSPFEVGAKPLFGELAAHYIQKELPEDQTQATIEKAYSTIRKYKRYLSRWALPRWGTIPALAVRPPDVEDWLRELKKKFELRNPTLGEIRKAMKRLRARTTPGISAPHDRRESHRLRAPVACERLRTGHPNTTPGA